MTKSNETDPVKAAVKSVRGYLIIGSILLGMIEGAFRFAGNTTNVDQGTAMEKLWAELRSINDTLGQVRIDLRVLQESEKQNLRRDNSIMSLERRMGAIEIQEARTEGRIIR